jgi:hypothetical protein
MVLVEWRSRFWRSESTFVAEWKVGIQWMVLVPVNGEQQSDVSYGRKWRRASVEHIHAGV